MKNDQFQEIKELVEILEGANLTELEIERKDFRVRIKREPKPIQGPSSVQPVISKISLYIVILNSMPRSFQSQ